MDRETVQAHARRAAADIAALLDIDDEPILAMHLEVFANRLLVEVRDELGRTLEQALSGVAAIGERGPDLRTKRSTEILLRDAAQTRLDAIEAQLARARGETTA